MFRYLNLGEKKEFMKRILALALIMSVVPSLAQKRPVLDTNEKKPYRERMEKYIKELFDYKTM